MPYTTKKNKKLFAKLEYSRLSTLQSKIKELDIIVYSSKFCLSCLKLNSMLAEEKLEEFIEYETENYPDFVEQVPYILSRKTGKKVIGVPQSVETLLFELS